MSDPKAALLALVLFAPPGGGEVAPAGHGHGMHGKGKFDTKAEQ